MQTRIICLLVLLTITILSCNKEKDDTPKPDVKGFWRGYIGDPAGIFLSIINHNDGSGRAYCTRTTADTVHAEIKMNGKWKVTDGVFYGTYVGPFLIANDTATFQGFMQTPFKEIQGVLMFRSGVGGVPFRIVKVE